MSAVTAALSELSSAIDAHKRDRASVKSVSWDRSAAPCIVRAVSAMDRAVVTSGLAMAPESGTAMLCCVVQMLCCTDAVSCYVSG